MNTGKNYMTPYGHHLLQEELRCLLRQERPKVVEIVSWAASNGDRSENGDYIYGKKRLREIDRRIHYLTKQLGNAEIIDPKRQQNLTQVFFGATVSYLDQNQHSVTIKLVGVDEADFSKGKISWRSPIAKALMKARRGDTIQLQTPQGKQTIEIISIQYLSEDT